VERNLEQKPIGIRFCNATRYLNQTQRLIVQGWCLPKMIDRSAMDDFSLSDAPFARFSCPLGISFKRIDPPVTNRKWEIAGFFLRAGAWVPGCHRTSDAKK
jgi:hypothetical protein